GQRHAARMDLQDVQPSRLVGYADGDLTIEPAGPAQRRIERIGNVGGADDDDLSPRLQPVHEREQLRYDPALDLLLAAQRRPLGRDRIDFIEEDDARPGARLLEYAPQVRFAFAVELVHDLGAAETEELGVGLVGDGAGDERLAASRRAVQENAFRRFDAQPLENFRITQGQLDHLADGAELALQPADILVGDPLRQHLDAAAAAADLDRGHRLDDHRPLGPGLQHGEVPAARAHQHRADTVAGEQHQAFEEAADIVIFALFAGVTQRGERRQPDLLGGTVIGALQSQPFAQPGPGIVTGQAIDLHDVFPAILRKRRHRFGNGCPLSGQPNDIARR